MSPILASRTRARRRLAASLAALCLPCVAWGQPVPAHAAAAVVISAGQEWAETVAPGVAVWRSPEEHAPGKLALLTGEPARYTIELQRVSAVRCANRFLEAGLVPWKFGVAEAWLLPRAGNAFIVSDALRDNMEREAPELAPYSEDELRRAMNAGGDREGLASVQAARACRAQAWGERYVVRHDGKIEHELYIPHASGQAARKPSGRDLAMHLAHRYGFGKPDAYDADAHPWPGDPTRIIAAYASLQRADTAPAPDEETYDLDLLVVDAASGKVLQRYLDEGAFMSDAMHFDGFWLDTANYAVKPGGRAFGVRSAAHHQGCAYSETVALDLYELQGKTMRKILSGLDTNDKTGMCQSDESSAMKRTLAMAASSTNGYRDVMLSELVEGDNAICGKQACPDHRRRRNFLLRFDGDTYVMPKESP